MNRTFIDRSRWPAVALFGATLLLAGCTASEPSKPSFLPFGHNAREESLRKQVEADSFPSAQKAGLKPVE